MPASGNSPLRQSPRKEGGFRNRVSHAQANYCKSGAIIDLARETASRHRPSGSHRGSGASRLEAPFDAPKALDFLRLPTRRLRQFRQETRRRARWSPRPPGERRLAQNVGLELHKEIIHSGAAVDTKFVMVSPESASIASMSSVFERRCFRARRGRYALCRCCA